MTEEEQHATAIIEKGQNALADDSKHGLYWLVSGHLQLAHIHADEPGTCLEHLMSVVDTLITGYRQHSIAPSLEKQNDAIVYAAAAGRLDKARAVAAIPVATKDSHGFDILLNHHLRHAIGLSSPYGSVRYQPTKSEVPLFRALQELVASPSASVEEGLHKYWKATRNKRYAQTVHQRVDLFAMAGRKIQQASAG